MRFSIFLTPRPDEVLLHYLTRYYRLFRFPNADIFRQMLFTSRHTNLAVDLPMHIDLLLESMPNNHPAFTASSIIQNHTMYPYYCTYLPNHRRKILQQKMQSSENHNLHLYSGITASKVKTPTWFRHCLECAKVDRDQFGETFWHRLHQLPGVLVCPIHQTPLIETKEPIRHTVRNYELHTAGFVIQSSLGTKIPIAPVYLPYLIRLATNSKWLLNHPPANVSPDWIRNQYLERIKPLGLVSYSGRIRIAKLLPAIQAHFPKGLLNLLNCPISDGTQNWVINLLRPSQKSTHPLYHLLLLDFFQISIAEFFQTNFTFRPFGAKPWPCLNTVCSFYKKEIIENCVVTISLDSRRPVGEFCCPYCQFTYSRLGPDTSTYARQTRTRIINFGEKWEEKLRKLWCDESTSLRELSRVLGVASRTIKRQIVRLNLPMRRNGNRGGVIPKIKEKELTTYSTDFHNKRREQWLNLQVSNPELTVTQLRNLDSRLFTWLYRHDTEWLNANKPVTISNSVLENYRINWPARDLLITAACLHALITILTNKQKVIQHSKTAIANKTLYVHYIFKNSNKLPCTTQFLTRANEERISFAIRRIWHTVNHSDLDQEWQLIRQAGLNRVQKEPRIQQMMQEAFLWLNNSICAPKKSLDPRVLGICKMSQPCSHSGVHFSFGKMEPPPQKGENHA